VVARSLSTIARNKGKKWSFRKAAGGSSGQASGSQASAESIPEVISESELGTMSTETKYDLNMVTEQGTIEIPTEELAGYFSKAIIVGSSKVHLRPSDFDFAVNLGKKIDGITNVPDLLKAGMLPIDAVYYLQCKKQGLPTNVQERTAENEKVVSETDAGIGMFIWFFSLLTQGKHVLENEPKFLSQSLKLGKSWKKYQEQLTSCDFAKLPTDWIKAVKLSSLSDKARNRLALGAAGHRMIAALRYIRRADLREGCAEGEAFVHTILEWTQGKSWWDLHPLFKSAAVISATSSLNQLIGEFLAEAVTAERLQTLKQNKVIFEIPKIGLIPGRWAAQKLKSLPKLQEEIGGIIATKRAPEPTKLPSGYKINEQGPQAPGPVVTPQPFRDDSPPPLEGDSGEDDSGNQEETGDATGSSVSGQGDRDVNSLQP